MRKVLTAGLALALLTSTAPATGQAPLPGETAAQIAPIEGVIAAGAQWEVAWSGPMTADGMSGDSDGALLFAQEQSNSIRKLWPDGKEWVHTPYIHGAGAISFDSVGRLFAVERTCTDPGLRLPAPCTEATRVVQLAPERKVPASAFADGRPLGRLNDLAADGHGGAYVTQTGVYHVAADGTVSVVAEGGGLFTNGLVLSPDAKTLYVTNRGTIVAFDVGEGGATSNRRDFATLGSEPQGGFGGDGLAVDSDGRLYVTADAGIYVFDSSGGELGIIPVPRRAITVAFAGPDRRTLYVGAMGAVTPDGIAWTTPEGVRNVAMTVYRVPMLARGPEGRPK
jgi:gluconolactonase